MKFKAHINGDLRNLVDRANSKGYFITIQTKLYAAMKIFEACDYLWSQDLIVHNDLKLDNMLMSDCRTRVLLCDFGHASPLDKILS